MHMCGSPLFSFADITRHFALKYQSHHRVSSHAVDICFTLLNDEAGAKGRGSMA